MQREMGGVRTRYEIRDEDGRLVWPYLASEDEALAIRDRLKKGRPWGTFSVKAAEETGAATG